MKIVVFGANGNVGRLVVERALTEGHSVIAAIHNQNPFDKQENLDVAQVNVFDKASVANVVEGCDSVLSCLGSWGTKSKNILTKGMEAIVPAMEASNISRIVTLTGAAAMLPNENFGFVDSVNRKALQIVAGKVLDDGEQHLQLLQQSSLAWTTIRSPVMNSLGSENYKLSKSSPLPTQTINRQAVADAMVDLVDSENYTQEAPFIIRGKSE